MDIEEFKDFWSGDYAEATKYQCGEITVGIKALVVLDSEENHTKFIVELQDLLHKYAI